jgi:hypothetical protein
MLAGKVLPSERKWYLCHLIIQCLALFFSWSS